jgi:hypothetical protein
MAEAIYVLCALTSAACALLLLRAFARTRVRLLLWSALCFVGLTGNNVLLFADLVMWPESDLSLVRGLAAMLALAVLVYGLVTDSE